MATINLANAAVLDGTSSERREGYHVLVEGEYIKEVSDRPITCDGARTIDLRGCTLMPGLIDAHVHVIAVDAALARARR
jgi:imidazolonepropionase-like amidohydrolase